jgi:molybdenum cofactor biosynthesis enzyme MoaA
MANNKKDCNECHQREKTGFRESGRQLGLRYIPEHAVDGDPYILEFQIDTKCNAACSICGPHFSDLWQKQLGIDNLKNNVDQFDQLLSTINFDKVTLIKFFGGEPLLTDTHLNILQLIKHPKNTELLYSTNGSIFPSDEVIDIWKKFKEVRLSFSIDAIEKQFEYVRWPLKWSRVESNLISVAKSLPNIKVGIHCTINPMTVFYIRNLMSWLENIQQTENISLYHSFSPCFGTWGIDAIPKTLSKELFEIYPDTHSVIGILKSFPPAPDKYKKLIKNMDGLDNTRQLNWRETFSDVVKYFE